eukprot:2533379-Amphidinium_carterae.1
MDTQQLTRKKSRATIFTGSVLFLWQDGMIVQGQKGVVTPPGRFPIVPGIDAAGEVLRQEADTWPCAFPKSMICGNSRYFGVCLLQ